MASQQRIDGIDFTLRLSGIACKIDTINSASEKKTILEDRALAFSSHDKNLHLYEHTAHIRDRTDALRKSRQWVYEIK